MKTKIIILVVSITFISFKNKDSKFNYKKDNSINIQTGSGKFIIEGGHRKTDSIRIHYHKPKNFTKESSVIFVIPGGDRNGDDYRDSWIKKSEQYNVCLLYTSPSPRDA